MALFSKMVCRLDVFVYNMADIKSFIRMAVPYHSVFSVYGSASAPVSYMENPAPITDIFCRAAYFFMAHSQQDGHCQKAV
jgi:hypothetical protein